MAELDEQLSQILGNPQIMQQIATLAQSFNTSQRQAPAQEKPPETVNDSGGNNMNLSTLRNLLDASHQMGIDKNQQTLLRALNPYLSRNRITKLERAMQAAKLAQAASLFLNANNQRNYSGR